MADIQQIKKDIPRTFLDQPDVLRLSKITEEVLQKYAAADMEVGYCQGMSFVAAVTAFQFRSADAAYPHFSAVVHGLRGLWLPGLPLVHTGVVAFGELSCSCFEDLQACLGEQMVSLDMFLPEAWLTLFSRWLPFPSLWATLEFVKAEAFPGVLAITVLLLKAHRPFLVGALGFQAVYTSLKELAKLPEQPDVMQLLASARELLPRAQGALMRAGFAERSAEVSRCGSRIIHTTTGVELLECGGWPMLAGAIQAVAERAGALGDAATEAGASARDHFLGALGVRHEPSSPSSSSMLSTHTAQSLSWRGARLPRLHFCTGRSPKDDA